MVAVIPIIVGFLSSLLPKLLEFFTDRADRKHELAILDRQMEMQRLGHEQRLEEIQVQAHAEELDALLQHDATLQTDSKIISALRASVRPVMTYLFFALFCAVKLMVIARSSSADIPPADMIIMAWDDDTSTLFSAIVSFWFGHRAIKKSRTD